MSKKKTKKELPLHKIRFKKEPIWIKANFLGKYNGINFRFDYKEYTNPEAEEVIKHFSFKWPGRIPEDKEYAEKGIKALFEKRREANTLDYKVVMDDAISIAESEEELHIDKLIEEADAEDEIVQEGHEGED